MSLLGIIKVILFFFTFIFIAGMIFWGMQWFSESMGGFFMQQSAMDQQAFLGSAQDSVSASSLLAETPEPEIEDLNIDAGSVFSVKTDFSGSEKILFEKEKEKKSAIASLTKLMTATVVLENYDLSQGVEISKEAVAQFGYFKLGEFISVKNLLYAMLIGSDNTAAYALSELIGRENFVNLMNAKAKEMGLSDTFYSDAVGFSPESYSTAKDLKNLAKILLKERPLIFDITAMPEFSLNDFNGNFHHKVVATDQLLTDFSAGWRGRIVGGKTGNNNEAGQCLVLVLKTQDNEGYIINIILNSKNRFEDMKNLISWTNEKYGL